MMKNREDESSESRNDRLLKNRLRAKEWRRLKGRKTYNKCFEEKLFKYGNGSTFSEITNIDKESIEAVVEYTNSDTDTSHAFSNSEYDKSNKFEQINVQLRPKGFKCCQRDILGDFMNQNVCALCDMILEAH